MRVYTFTMPKFLSSFVRKCMVVFQKDDKPKSQVTATANQRNRKKKKEKTSG
ncbi:stage V sporulation protein SpoVM [Sporosarcina sp. Sa2YVA2]|uniref:Stage V sporulation protein SpoVM n=1 Tax=Sporosarcina quadrami TaxID=2762234 RepID=A0ABR8U708_9BACL|nr:stage V sporulation protein SpoVM [Sporosarcina quadrami]MBD7983488.1 stage V sporulation protein SpoVM [Sporosarcina quadrami]